MFYFFLPLIGTLEFSLRMRRGVYSLDAYRVVFADPKFQATFGYSVVMALLTILLGVLLVVPTAYWVRLRSCRAGGRSSNSSRFCRWSSRRSSSSSAISGSTTPPRSSADRLRHGTNFLLLCGYAVLALPYMYRAINTGLRTIDIATLTEAAQSLGAGWLAVMARVILPNVMVACSRARS